MDGKKKNTSFFSPTNILKKGMTTLGSPLIAMKDTLTSSTPRFTTSSSSSSNTTNRTTMPNPSQYPGLFDVRGPNSGTGGHHGSIGDGKHSSGGGSRTNSTTSRNSSRTSSRDIKRDEIAPAEDVAMMDEEERAYMTVLHHNLHSVLTNPKVSCCF
jgi:hypothetical protein